MMNQKEFIDLFSSEKEQYEAWGEFIAKLLNDSVAKDLLKLPIKSRVKDGISLVDKAFYRNKNYTDPYNDITDKVGLRVVVLLNQEVEKVCSFVESCTEWTFSKDRNYFKERFAATQIFDYESVHYILYNQNPRELPRALLPGMEQSLDTLQVRSDICAELQIRTLLQHAQSELTHDLIHKPVIAASPEVKRTAARSAALIEVTGELFSKVDDIMSEVLSKRNDFESGIKRLMGKHVPDLDSKFNERLNSYVLLKLETLAQNKNVNLESIESLIDSHSDLIETLQRRESLSLLALQPVSLLIFALADKAKFALKSAWLEILPDAELEPYYIALGIPFPD